MANVRNNTHKTYSFINLDGPSHLIIYVPVHFNLDYYFSPSVSCNI